MISSTLVPSRPAMLPTHGWVPGIAWASMALLFATASLGAQSSDGFVELFDTRSLDGWVVENSAGSNFSVQDGAIRVDEPEGWLRSEGEYSDFELRLEFRLLSDGADSGVFVRAIGDEAFARGWPNRSYQIQLRDMNQPSRFLPLGGIYRHGMPEGETSYDEEAVESLYRGVGEWHELTVVLEGERLIVSLEGEEIARAENITNPAGFIGFQGETGTVEYRSIRIREAD